jgi:hypothetical protein
MSTRTAFTVIARELRQLERVDSTRSVGESSGGDRLGKVLELGRGAVAER